MTADRPVPAAALSTRPRAARLALWLLLVPVVAQFPAQLTLARPRWSVMGLWDEPMVQAQTRVGTGVDLTLIDEADRRLPADARVLVVTPGRNPRGSEYMTYHRSRYWLAPRPVWWLVDAPRDGTWESRWWIPDPLTPGSIEAFARAHAVTHALVFGDGGGTGLGVSLIDQSGGRLVALDERLGAPSPTAPPYGPSWPARPVLLPLAAAVFVVLTLGLAVRLVLMAPGRPASVSLFADAWWLGSVALTVGLFWLDRLHLPAGWQYIVLSALAVAGLGAAEVWRRGRRAARPDRPTPPDGRASGPRQPTFSRAAGRLAMATLVINVVFVGVLAIGQPLVVWDSWASWAAKARAIHRAGSLSHMLSAEFAALDPHGHYPPAVPLREAWVFGWLGAPDDRWVGILTLFDYLALLALLRSALLAAGAGQAMTRVSLAVAAAVFPLATGAGSAMPDVTITLLAVAALTHLLQWTRSAAASQLVLAGLAAGALGWFKLEGAVLAGVLMAGIACVRLPSRSTVPALATIGAACAAIALPWWWLGPDPPAADADFAPMTGAALAAGLNHAWPIARGTLRILVDPLLGLVWPATGLVLVFARREGAGHWRAPGHLPLLVAIAYAAIMALPYLLSTYTPLEAHIRNSYYRLAAQVTPLLVLWLGLHAYSGQDE